MALLLLSLTSAVRVTVEAPSVLSCGLLTNRSIYVGVGGDRVAAHNEALLWADSFPEASMAETR